MKLGASTTIHEIVYVSQGNLPPGIWVKFRPHIFCKIYLRRNETKSLGECQHAGVNLNSVEAARAQCKLKWRKTDEILRDICNCPFLQYFLCNLVVTTKSCAGGGKTSPNFNNSPQHSNATHEYRSIGLGG